MSGRDLPEDLAMGVTAVGMFLLIPAGITSGVLHGTSDETVADWWLMFWSSRLDHWTVKLASVGLPSQWNPRRALVREPIIPSDEEAGRIWNWAEAEGG